MLNAIVATKMNDSADEKSAFASGPSRRGVDAMYVYEDQKEPPTPTASALAQEGGTRS